MVDGLVEIYGLGIHWTNVKNINLDGKRMMTAKQKGLYPTVEQIEEQAKYLSKLPEPIYRLFQRWGIPSEVASKIKRPQEVNNELEKRTS